MKLTPHSRGHCRSCKTWNDGLLDTGECPDCHLGNQVGQRCRVRLGSGTELDGRLLSPRNDIGFYRVEILGVTWHFATAGFLECPL